MHELIPYECLGGPSDGDTMLVDEPLPVTHYTFPIYGFDKQRQDTYVMGRYLPCPSARTLIWQANW